MDPNFVIDNASDLIANPNSQHPSISAGKLMPLLLEYFAERARENLDHADTLDGSYGFHNLNPSAGLYGQFHSATGTGKDFPRITATTDSLAIQPTKVHEKKKGVLLFFFKLVYLHL